MTDPTPSYAKYDLHLHTYWSYDATTQPESYFKHARKHGIRCIAITDHHIIDSEKEVAAITPKYPEIRFIPAAELSVDTSFGAIDLLCYGFPKERPPELTKVFNRYHEWQRAIGAAFSEGMLALGHDFTDAHRLELLQSYRPAQTIDLQGNTHVKGAFICDYFVKRGFIAKAGDHPDLINRLQEKVSFPPYPDVESVTAAVKASGALIAIAHPFFYFNGHDIKVMDTLREECSLDGIECAHKIVPPKYTTLYRDYCLQHNLFSVGGSDCHSDNDINDSVGLHNGKDEWLDEFLARLN
ncbi:MAG: PHP domain-containing protein [Opitutaceae bacterium]|nr:PHP domain-containing protein [Opitutaceae bacterium]